MNAAADLARADPDPLAPFDLDTLLEGAARLRADRLGLRDPLEALTFGEADARAGALAATFGELGLVPGETILLAAGAQAITFVALVAGLRAGLHVALAPAWADHGAAGRMALLSRAAAIVAAAGNLESAPIQDWLPVAAAAPSVRLVCSLGAEKMEGAVCIDLAGLEARRRRSDAAVEAARAQIVTFESSGSPVAHRQRTLVAAALDIVARARIGMRLPIISTIPPASFAGLAAGPIASLIAGAPLHWQVPFEASRFLAMLDDAETAHLVAPAALAPMLQRAGLLASPKLASLLLLSRQESWRGVAAPSNFAMVGRERSPPVVDLYAFGEKAVVPELRGLHGAVSPAAEPHHLDLDGSQLLAVGWSGESGERRLQGAAVSGEDG